MKLTAAIPVVLAVSGLVACQANAADGVNINTPAVGVRVNGDHAAPGVEVGTPSTIVDAKTEGRPTVRVEPPRDPPRIESRPGMIGDNRADPWRYKWENNRWWYYTPDSRWMWYSTPGGWTYYDTPGSYTTGYGGAPVTTVPVTPTPAPDYVVPSPTYYYGYPGYYYYGRPGVYIGGPRWGYGYGYRGRGRW